MQLHRPCLTLLAALVAFAGSAASQTADSVRTGLAISGYGTINYFNYEWDTDPSKRDAIDVERLVLYPLYQFNLYAFVKAEIEFEHGGTGVTKEFDRFEEFGEFETEVEAGGEVLLEQLHVDFAVSERFGIRVGRFKLPIGIATYRDEPGEYFTTTRSPAEVAIIPVNWYETGLQAYGRVADFAYVISVISGLDATGFSSASWIARGNQKRFETINAEDFAITARLDWHGFQDADSRIGLSFYAGDSADNRPKPDLDVSAVVTVFDAHADLRAGALQVRALVLYGRLGNAEAVTKANRNLSNNLNVKRTPVASAALAWYVEAGYDVLRSRRPLTVFLRYAYYDSMHSTEGAVFDNPRWQRTAYTAGLNWHAIDQVVFKATHTHRRLGLTSLNVENTFSLGLGFEF